ncbi:MAG: divergent polysaccharide deacetylase family protein [Emcibacter sp.]|nr:divergent polysaccharide deacetylase family protein [Emcibacter sp.]
MVDTPELTSITRNRTVRPLVAAWVFVIVILVVGFTWLSLSEDTAPVEDNSVDASPEQPLEADIAISDNAPSHIAANLNDEPHTPPIEEAPPHKGISLVKAPIDGLFLTGANGLLPVLGPDGMVAWKEYARPAKDVGDLPKIAIIVTGIGLSKKTTEFAIKHLPGQIDLGFSPYGQRLQNWMDMAREYGHEGFLMIPTEPLKYPENDPGPHTLMTGASPRDNLKKLDWLLSQVTGYVGVINEMGSRFTASEKDVMPILDDLNARGLMLLDSRSTRFSTAAKLARRIGMPRAFNNLYIDNIVSTAEITKNLTALENTARTYGTAVGVARAFPLSIREIEKWAQALERRGIQLVPITAIANRQPIR